MSFVLMMGLIFIGCSKRNNPVGLSSSATESDGSGSVESSKGSALMKWGFASYNVKNLYEWDASLTISQRIDRLVSDLKAANAKWYRPNFIWIDIEPVIKVASMTRAGITYSMIYRYAFPEYYSDWSTYPYFYRPDWSVYDILTSKLYDNGINIFPVICNGDSKQLPLYKGEHIYPGSQYVSKESYMAHAKLHAAAVAMRYKYKIQYYQAENELNCAGLQVFPWLARDGYWAWNDWTFQTNLLTTIAGAIRSKDSDALIATNFVTILCDWHSHINDWTSGANAVLLDVVGVDVYSNYLYGWPIDVNSVGGCVTEAYQYSNGKPVIVSETGYPTNPSYLGYNESNQSTYVWNNMEDAWSHNAKGFLYYRLVTKESASSGGFPQENYWGFVRSNNTYKPAFTKFRDKSLAHPYVK